MAPYYSYAVVRFAPDDARDERLNIGALVFKSDGLDLRITRRLDRVKALTAALELSELKILLENLDQIDSLARKDGLQDVAARAKNLSLVGPLRLSNIGCFSADNADAYEDRINAVLSRLVEPEPALRPLKTKKSRLLSQIKSVFRREGVLADKVENLDSHRIVSSFHLAEGLDADLVLKNGLYHVVETVDASGDDDSLRKAISSIAISALILEQARIIFGEELTKSRLVYSASVQLEKAAKASLEAAQHQGAELINWDSVEDRYKFVETLLTMAMPKKKGRRNRSVTRIGGDLFH